MVAEYVFRKMAFFQTWKKYIRRETRADSDVRGFVAENLCQNIDVFNEFYNVTHFEAITENVCTI